MGDYNTENKKHGESMKDDAFFSVKSPPGKI